MSTSKLENEVGSPLELDEVEAERREADELRAGSGVAFVEVLSCALDETAWPLLEGVVVET